MATYTYTIFDADPQSSSGAQWPSHQDIEIEADCDADAVEEVESVMSVEAAGLNPSDGYEAGNSIHAIVWSDDGTIVGQPSYELTHQDLGTDSAFEEVQRLLADLIEVREGSEGTIALTAIEDDGEGSGDETLAEIRAALGSAYTAEWTGDSDTDEDGVTTSDVRIERVAS